jgi:hypothetical protein
MRADAYLQNVLNREAVNTSSNSPVLGAQTVLRSIVRAWAGDQLCFGEEAGKAQIFMPVRESSGESGLI